MNKILMCPPDYFDIEYSINPWMDTSVKADSSKTQQWNDLKAIYDKLGHEVTLLEPQEGLPDMVYVDAGILFKNTFIPSNFRYPERQGESIHYENWFRENGFEIKKITPEFYFEGHGDTLIEGENIFFGYGFRSTVEAMFEAQRLLEDKANIVPMELTDARFYHLDTCFTPLKDNKALMYTKGFSKKAIKQAEKYYEIIDIPEEEATYFVCNSVLIGNDIISPSGAESTHQKLRDLGYTVHPTPMSEFIKGGGACKCLSMIVG